MAETIFAQATAGGRAGISVIRISGPEAFAAIRRLTGERPHPRRASLRWLRDPESGEPIDQGLVLGFPGPASFTGEDVAELQVHGSPAVTRALLAVLGGMRKCRPAEPGEFTRRALINGRLDLAQVEGLGDLIAAETLAQHRQAVRLMDGALSRTAAGWRAVMVGALAQIEVSIDFADEDLPGDLLATVRADLGRVIAEMQRELAGSRIAERVRGGFEVALVGRPNVGKSTLLNALAGREAALTSEVAGTTRDVIEVRMDLDGLPITLLDMAGLRSSAGVEALGIARARQRAALADLRLLLVDTPEDVAALGIDTADGDLVVLAKADLRTEAHGLAVSGTTGSGIDAVLAALSAELGHRVALAATVSHERQVRAVARSLAGVSAAHAEFARSEPAVEVVAEELQSALRALDFLVGKVDVEAVLDVVFASFCLGK